MRQDPIDPDQTVAKRRAAQEGREADGVIDSRWYIRVPPPAVTLPQRVQELVGLYGSIRAAARVLRVDHAYLSRLKSGAKTEPSAALLRKMGLRRVVTYQRAKR